MGFRKFANSAGRASRSEYWYWTLFTVVIDILSLALDKLVFPDNAWGPIDIATTLWLLLPSVAVSMRRLHDIYRTGRWVLLAVTIIGLVPLIIWALRKGTDGDNDFGPDPLADAISAMPATRGASFIPPLR
jgi:uncharacterized membrane protein YhaH (DUF805 family)